MAQYNIKSTTLPPCYPCVCHVTGAKATVANCSYLELVSVPSFLPNTIDTLLLDNNNISTLPSKAFSKFEKLDRLDISNNSISEVMADSFKGLTHLRSLRMQGNRVRFPEKAISILLNLEELSVDGDTNMTFGEPFRNLSKLTNLTISGHLGNVTNETFTYISNLKLLDVSKCNLENIASGAFLPLKYLEELDISHNNQLNYSNFESATYGLINSSIHVLKASGIVQSWSFCNILMKRHTQYLKKTKLQELYFDYNRLEYYESGALSHFPETLWLISARFNKFSNGPHILEFLQLKNVTHLYFGNDGRGAFPYMPNFEQSPMNAQCGAPDGGDFRYTLDHDVKIPSTHMMILPANLQELHIICEPLHFDVPRVRFTHNKLTVLNLNCNLLERWIGPVEGLENLEKLDLSDNFANYISTFFFSSFSRLKVLNLSSNFIGNMMGKGNQSLIFDNLTSLEVLDLSLNEIHSLPEDIFRGLTSLKTLRLSHNTLYLDMPLRVNHMKNLELIDLTDNQIRWLSATLRQDLDTLAQTNNLTVNLLQNPLSCTCKDLEFLHWIKTSPVGFIHVFNYTCAFANKTFSPVGKFQDTYYMLERQCANHMGLILGCIFAIIVIFLIIGAAMTYRYRWNLRYWYYAARLKYKREPLIDDEGDPFKFDAFISHADEDEGFVVNEMLKRVETVDELRLNIHCRDFIPGREIISNIMSAIQRSKKTVVVLSKHFLESYWCKYELQMANLESIKTGRDVLIIIMYEDISTRQIPKEVLFHLKTESYITYPHGGTEDQIDLFWRRFVDAVQNN